jgi:hypothetical protein
MLRELQGLFPHNADAVLEPIITPSSASANESTGTDMADEAAGDAKNLGEKHHEDEGIEQVREEPYLVNRRKRVPLANVRAAPEDSETQKRGRRVTTWKEYGRKHIYVAACYHPILTPEIEEMRRANGAYAYRWEIYVEREHLGDGLRRGRRYFLDTNWEDVVLFNHWATG